MEHGARKRGRARARGLCWKSTASVGESSGSAEARAQEQDAAGSIPEQPGSGSVDNMADRCANFSRLPFEVLVIIFSKVNEISGNQVVLCAEVCKEWHSAATHAVTSATLTGSQADARTHISPDEMALGIVKSYPNLQKLCIERSLAGSRGWTGTFVALGQSCPNLQHLTISDIFPTMRGARAQQSVTSELLALAPCMPKLHSFHFKGHLPVGSLLSFSALKTLTLDMTDVPDLDNLPSLRHLTIVNGWLPTPFLHNTMNLKTLILEDIRMSSFEFLWHLPHLQILKITGPIKFSPDHMLPHLPALRNLALETARPLDFSDNPQITALRFLRDELPFNSMHNYQVPCLDSATAADFSSLKFLTTFVTGTRQIRALAVLPRLVHATLILHKPQNYEDLEPVTEPFELPSTLELALEVSRDVSYLTEMASLRPVSIHCSSGLPSAFEPLGWLPLVQHLDLRPDTVPLPQVLSKLTGLKHLSYTSSAVKRPRSVSIPDLKHMVCQGINHKLGPLDNLKSLVSLQLNGDDSSPMKSAPKLPSNLQNLSITNLIALKRLPLFANLSALKQLHVWGCSALEAVPPLGGLISVQSLAFAHCPLVRDLPQVAELCQLRVLDVSGSHHLSPCRSPSVAAVGSAVHVIL